MAARELQCKVVEYRELSPTVFEILFEASEPFTFEAGQFISIVIPKAGPNGRDLRRAYSIASAPEKTPIELSVKLVEGGPGTNYLYKLRPGDMFKGYAPYGDFVFEKKTERQACFISTGTGIAPFKSMMESKSFQANLPKATFCLFGSRDESEILYEQTIKKLSFAKWICAVSRPKAEVDFKGRVTDFLRSEEAQARQAIKIEWLNCDYYLCGSGAMIDEVKSILQSNGVQKGSIFQEVYYKTTTN